MLVILQNNSRNSINLSNILIILSYFEELIKLMSKTTIADGSFLPNIYLLCYPAIIENRKQNV